MKKYGYWKDLREKDIKKYRKLKKIQNTNYLLKKIEKRGYLTIPEFNKLTRLIFGEKISKVCMVCGSEEDLHIHHKRYSYPININDLVRLCRKCHIEVHQYVTHS